MADENLKLMDLKEELKELRRCGFYGYIHNASVLQVIMNCEDAPPEYMASCFVRIVRYYIPDQARSDFLLATVGLLKGFDHVNRIEKRYKKFYIDFIEPNQVLSTPESTLQKRSNSLIEILAKYLLREKSIEEVIADIPRTFELPEARQKASDPSYDIFIDELGYYERALVKLPYKKKKRYIFFIKLMSVMFYIVLAIIAIAYIISPSTVLSELEKNVLTISLIVGGVLVPIIIGKICGVLFGYKKREPSAILVAVERLWNWFRKH